MPGAVPVRAGKAYVELGTLDRTARGLRRAQRRLRAFGQSVSMIGASLAKAGALFAVPLAIGTKVFMDFEQQLANVSTMLDEPGKHMDRFRAGIRRMAVEFGESTEALAGGLYDILSASIAPAKALDVLTAATKAAKAGMTDTKTAADAITTILNSYGLAAEKATDVSDLLFAVVKRGKTTFAELAPTIGLVASTAAVAGVPLEELGAMIATLTRNGVRTENAVTAVNRTIATFLKPTDDAARYAKSLGLELSTTTLKADGLLGVFKRISTLPPEAVARLFPNIRALRGVLPALKHLDEFADDVQLMTNRAGRTEEAYRKMADSLAHWFKQTKQAVVIALGRIGQALRKVLAGGAARIRQWADGLASWIKANERVVVALAKIALGLLALGVGLFLVGKIVAVFAGLIGVVRGAVIAFKALQVAAAFLWANPILIPIAAAAAAIGALVYALKRARTSQEEFNKSVAEAHEKARAHLAVADQQIARLGQLAQKQELSNDEILEACDLVDALEAAYGHMGITVDRTTGKISGLIDAQRKLNQARLREEIFETERKYKGALGKRGEVWAETTYRSAGKIIRKRELLASTEAKVLRQKLVALRRLEAADKGLPSAAGKGKAEEEAKAREAAAQSAGEQIENIDRRIHRLAIAQIEDEKRREIAAIGLRYDGEVAKAQGNDRLLRRLDAARNLELAAAAERHDAKARAEADRAAQERFAQEKDLQHSIERLEIEATTRGAARKRALLDLEEKRERTQAKELGVDEKLIGRRYDLLRQLAEPGATPQVETRGTFFTAALQSLFGGQGDAAERTAKATERTAKNLAVLVGLVRTGGATFT